MKRPCKKKHVIVFTRYPVPGKTKTRLIPALGAVGAAEFNREITEKTVNTVLALASRQACSAEVCFTGGNISRCRAWLGTDMGFTKQGPGDLGTRMRGAFSQAFANGASQVILVGTDIPDLATVHLDHAFGALSRHDVVLGPSTDGGYFLVGLNKDQHIFSQIPWSTPEVMPRTLDVCARKNLTVHLMDPLVDVDTWEDLQRVDYPGTFSGPYVSVVIPTLNEEDHIVRAIQSARHAASEILVVDGGSRDQTVKKAVQWGAKVFTAPRGRAAQQNYGAERSKGKILLFLHGDTRLPEGYVECIFDVLLDFKTVLGAFAFKTPLNTKIMRLYELGTHLRSVVFQMPYGDQCLFLKKKVFDRAGGFPLVPLAEDFLLVRRLSRLGKIRIAPFHAVTSGRRWENAGMLRTFFINQAILTGIAAGVSPDRLARLYNRAARRGGKATARQTGEDDDDL